MTGDDVERLPAGARALALGRQSGTCLFGSSVPSGVPDRVVAILEAHSSVGAVLPHCTIGGLGPAEGGRRAELAAGRPTAIAVEAGLLNGLSVDPHLDDEAEVVAAIASHVRDSGMRVVTEPSWVVEGPAVSSAEPERVFGSEILVITAFLDDGPAFLDDLLAFDLIRSLRDQVVDAQITVLLTDGFDSGAQVERLRANGVTVVVPPVDRDRWLLERSGRFSHAILTSSGMQSLSWSWLARTQPQAARILYLSALPFREVSALAPLTPPREQESLESVRSGVEAQVLEIARSADAIWCDVDADARWVRGCLPAVPVHVISSSIERSADAAALCDRRGILILGDAGHDVVAANEDAAGAALEQLVPSLRLRHPDLAVRVVAERPSPYLRHAATRGMVEVIGAEHAREAAARSRLILDLHAFGTGGEATIRLALASRTPFVAHPGANTRLDLGHLGAVSLFGAVADLSYRAEALLDDDDRWLHVQALMDQLVAEEFSGAKRAMALRAALCSLGIEARMAQGSWIEAGSQKDRPRHRQLPTVSTRPHGFRSLPLRSEGLPGLWEHDARYQLWAQRHGPTPDALAAIEADVRALPYHPLISVLVPVYNTPPDILRATIDSVRDQLYENWELCLADDCSSSKETQLILAEAAALGGVKVVRLEENSGISAATNAAAAVAEGEYFAFLDHDDLLKPHALAQVVRWLNADSELDYIYTDEDKVDASGDLLMPHLKPDWSPNHIMSQNYVCHLVVVRASLFAEVGGLRSSFDGSQDHDLVLRVVEQTERIAHIPEPLYTWRLTPGSTSAGVDAKPYAADAAKRALREALERRGRPGTVVDGSIPGMFRTSYRIPGSPRVAIIIPTKGALHLLEPCIRSIYQKSTYPNFDVVVVDNQTTDGPTLEYLANFPGRVVHYDHIFNYARMMNAAARIVDCDVLLFLNNDTEVITPDWIERLLEHVMRPEVGVVGGRLYFEPGRIQHEGILVGVGGWAANVDHGGYWGRGDIVRDTSAITGACTMIRSSVYWRVGGNEERLRVAYNDVDLCLRVRQAGYQVVYTPYAELFHYEGASRSGMEHEEDGPQFGIRWRPTEWIDPFYNPIFQPGVPPFIIGV